MTKTKKLLASALGLAVTLGITGGALAASHPSKARSEPVAATDADAVQQGDQTAPDTTVREAGSNAGSTEAGSNGAESSNEGQGSDGPGGHEDPSGSIDHQFNGQE